MKFLIMPNLYKKDALAVTKSVIAKLRAIGDEALMDSRYSDSFACSDVSFAPFAECAANCDMIIAVGGDGTVIHSAKHAVVQKKPILGVNAGRIGFISSIEPSELDCLDRIKTGEYYVQNRMLLDITVNGQEEKKYLALNDAVVSGGSLSRIIDFGVYDEDGLILNYRADGVIFSTPTGSTAYNLSAGGPVIQHDFDCIAVTPVCSHSIFARTIITSPQTKLRFVPQSLQKKNVSLFLTVDGEEGIELSGDDEVTVGVSKEKAEFVTFSKKPFYERLKSKLQG